MGFAIGQSPDGTETGVRVLFSDITPLASAPDIRSLVEVSTHAVLGVPPSGSAVGADGSVYVTAPHQVLKVTNGIVSVHAGDASSGYQNRLGTAARFNDPCGIAVNPVDGALIIAELAGNRIRRVDQYGSATLVAGTGSAGGTDERHVAVLGRGWAVTLGRLRDRRPSTPEDRAQRIGPTLGGYKVPSRFGHGGLCGTRTVGRLSSTEGVAVTDVHVYVADSGNADRCAARREVGDHSGAVAPARWRRRQAAFLGPRAVLRPRG